VIVLVTLALIGYAVWTGARWLGIVLMVAGLLLQVALGLRLLRATVGGVGGHAEWVRASSTRPRLHQSPGYFLALALIISGFALAVLLEP
jgi:hypothetical protein